MQIILTFSAVLICVSNALAQLAVTDAGTQAALQTSNVQQLQKWGESIGKLNEQLAEAKKYVELTTQVKDAIGDPTQIAGLIDSEILGGELSNAGVGELMSEVSDFSSGAQDLSDSSKELFTPIDFKNPLAGVNGTSDPYKKFEAFRSSYSNFEKVSKNTQERRTVLKQEALRLQQQLKTATTDAEVQKLQGQLEINNTALAALEQEQAQASNQVIAQAAANEQDEALATKQESDIIKEEEKQVVESINFSNSRPNAFIEVGDIYQQ